MVAERDLILAIDGSRRGDPLVILVTHSGELAWEPAQEVEEPVLVTFARQALNAHRDRVGRVVVTCGPGSYMGVRGGLAAASGAAQALRCPLALVGSLLLVAAQLDPLEDPVLALADAGRGGTFGQVVRASNPSGQRAQWLPDGPAQLLRRKQEWPAEWRGLGQATGSWGEERELPAMTTLLPLARDRRQALAWIASAGPASISGYDRISADYAEPIGAHPWS